MRHEFYLSLFSCASIKIFAQVQFKQQTQRMPHCSPSNRHRQIERTVLMIHREHRDPVQLISLLTVLYLN